MSSEQSVKPRHFEARIALMFFALFAAFGVHLPYFPLWLEAKGFGASEIAVILAGPMFLRVLTTPLITTLADRARNRADVLLAMALLTFVLSLAYFGVGSFVAILVFSLLLAVPWTPLPPLADSLALSGVRRFGSNYARMRIWGSASFLLANFAGGLLIATYGAETVPALVSGTLLLAAIAALALPRLGRPSTTPPEGRAPLARPALWSRYFVLAALGAGVVNGSHGFLYGFASIYWKAIGLDEGLFGLLWGTAVASEILMFMVFTRFFGRMATPMILGIAGLCSVVRWIAYPLVEPLGLGLAGFLAVQALHALSTGLILLGVQKLIAEEIGEERTGTAQGVAYFANGMAMALVTLASGPLYAALGANGFFVMAAVAAVGAVLVGLGALSAPKGRVRR